MAAWTSGILPVFLAALLTLAAPGAAHQESDAPKLNPNVARAWHEPEPVRPHEQWTGHLLLSDGHPYREAQYQVCNVADGVCFAPPHDAALDADGHASFDTSDYLDASGRPVDWQPGWRVGVKWILHDRAGNVTVLPPPPTDPADLEGHYLAFDIPGRPPGQGTPVPPVGALAAGLLLAVLAGRKQRRP